MADEKVFCWYLYLITFCITNVINWTMAKHTVCDWASEERGSSVANPPLAAGWQPPFPLWRCDSLSVLWSHFCLRWSSCNPFLFSHSAELAHQSLRQMGEGYVCRCSEVRHAPLSRGPPLISGWPPPRRLATFKDTILPCFYYLWFGSRTQNPFQVRDN